MKPSRLLLAVASLSLFSCKPSVPEPDFESAAKIQNLETRVAKAEANLQAEKEKREVAEKRVQDSVLHPPAMSTALRKLDVANARAYELRDCVRSLVKLKDSPGAREELEYADGRSKELKSQIEVVREAVQYGRGQPGVTDDELKSASIGMVTLETAFAELDKLLDEGLR